MLRGDLEKIHATGNDLSTRRVWIVQTGSLRREINRARDMRLSIVDISTGDKE
jgi:hypothetical protein